MKKIVIKYFMPREQTGSELLTAKSSESSHFSNLTKKYTIVSDLLAKIFSIVTSLPIAPSTGSTGNFVHTEQKMGNGLTSWPRDRI